MNDENKSIDTGETSAVWLHAVTVAEELDRMGLALDTLLYEMPADVEHSKEVKAAVASMEGAMVIARRALDGITSELRMETVVLASPARGRGA